ncbi:TPA: hypothetical protein RI707_003479 [Vibrio cholerae]|nr:hypothetical protein [Vibrio cholerae]HDV5298632.1 hypothetical protein [Vibrio cholerae]HDV5306142.1 hypothetical protein [Vibrio cholerae]HDV5309804.1 hypothetical protein [Vibrio cholerae]HDV5313466.1 hypothetical protein [Vibrio cholerae]
MMKTLKKRMMLLATQTLPYLKELREDETGNIVNVDNTPSQLKYDITALEDELYRASIATMQNDEAKKLGFEFSAKVDEVAKLLIAQKDNLALQDVIFDFLVEFPEYSEAFK